MPEDWFSQFDKAPPKLEQDWFSQFGATETPVIEEPKVVEPSEILPPESQGIGLRNIAAIGIRGASAFVPGGLLGALAGGLGEFAAQTIEPGEYNLAQIGTQAGLGAIPFGRVASIGRGLAKGATMGAGAVTASELAESGELPSIEQLGLGAGIGAIGGGIAGRVTRPRVSQIELPKPKPRMILKADGTLQNLETGEIFDKAGKKIETPIDRIKSALDEGFKKVKEQSASYTKERAERIAKVKEVETPGIAGTYERLGQLKGEYEKLKMPPLKDLLVPKDIDELANTIRRAPITDEFTKIHAETGLLKLLNGEIPQQSELDVLNSIWKTAIELPGTAKKLTASSKLRQAYELTRGLMSVDIPFMTSAAFRQGAPLAGTTNWFRAYSNAAKSFGSEKVYDKIMEVNNSNLIHQKIARITPSGKTKFNSIADEIGLAQSNLKTLTSRDEQIRSTLAERIPIYGKWVRGSNRAYTAFLNTLRTRTAEDWLKAADAIDNRGRLIDVVEGKKLANTINELTGHGSLRIKAPLSRFTKSGRELNLEKAADTVSLAFFSPRLLARDARMMNPLNYIQSPDLDRKQYLKGAIRRAGVWVAFTGLANQFLGAEVSSDITSSDFGKAKLGDTRLDAGTGLLQWIVQLGRQAVGGRTSSTSEEFTEFGSRFGAPTRGSTAADFLISRLHPTIGLGVEAFTASKYRPFHPISETLERMVPLFSGDLVDIIKEDPEVEKILLGLLGASSSMGVMTYGGGREPGEPTFNIPGDIPFRGGQLTNIGR